jgi:hypothetical protein
MIFIVCIRTVTRALGEFLGDSTLGSNECGFALAPICSTLLTPHLSRQIRCSRMWNHLGHSSHGTSSLSSKSSERPHLSNLAQRSRDTNRGSPYRMVVHQASIEDTYTCDQNMKNDHFASHLRFLGIRFSKSHRFTHHIFSRRGKSELFSE